MPNENLITSSTKELSTGTSTAAIIEGLLHGWHGVLIVLMASGTIIAIFVHSYEARRKAKLGVRGVRNYGITRIY